MRPLRRAARLRRLATADVLPVPCLVVHGPAEAVLRRVLLEPLVHAVVGDVDIERSAALVIRVARPRGEVSPALAVLLVERLLLLLAAEPGADPDVETGLAGRLRHRLERPGGRRLELDSGHLDQLDLGLLTVAVPGD